MGSDTLTEFTCGLITRLSEIRCVERIGPSTPPPPPPVLTRWQSIMSSLGLLPKNEPSSVGVCFKLVDGTMHRMVVSLTGDPEVDQEYINYVDGVYGDVVKKIATMNRRTKE